MLGPSPDSGRARSRREPGKRPDSTEPETGVIRRHLALLCDTKPETVAIRDFRKHLSWYAKGYTLGLDVRRRLAAVNSVADLEDLLARLDPAALPAPGSERLPRGKSSPQARVALPDGYLDHLDDDRPPEAHDAVELSGG